MRVSVFVEEALFCGEECALAVDVYGATFEDEVLVLDFDILVVGDLLRDGVVVMERWVFIAP